MRPLHEIEMSKKLFMLLSVEADNLSELLTRYSEKQLSKIRGFGKKRIIELKDLLRSHDSLARLKAGDDVAE
jgi:DNA-directed RNA polymerase alpha subunit